MKRNLTIIVMAVMTNAFAVILRPGTLPVSPWADTEVSTNLPFASLGMCNQMKEFRVKMSFNATPSNNVEVAFGCDADGDGVLSLEESGMTLSWDCGKWVFNRRFQFDPKTSGDNKEFVWNMRLNRDIPTDLVATENDMPLAGKSDFPSLAEFYDVEWNLIRVTIRGIDNANERIEIVNSLQGLIFKIR